MLHWKEQFGDAKKIYIYIDHFILQKDSKNYKCLSNDRPTHFTQKKKERWEVITSWD